MIIAFVEDPLKKPEPPNPLMNDAKDSTTKYIKTTALEKTIYKIGTLLQMSFGHLGADIVRENIVLLTTSQSDSPLEIMKVGHKINSIYMVCRINYYEAILECLEEDSTIYINKVVKIVHECVRRWNGSVNKNEGNLYLLTWKLPDVDDADHERNENLQELKTKLADQSLIAAVKVIAELRRAGELKSYFKNPNLLKYIGNSFETCVTFAIHQGWGIEGALGSEYKIDACYLSPQIAITYRIEQLCKYYDMPILLTENLYSLMSLKARNTLRKIDVITMKESSDPRGIFTFDISYTNLENTENIPDDHETGELIKLSEYANINVEGFKDKGMDYMFTLDNDIVEAQSNILEFNPLFRQLFKCYIAGEWTDAYECIQRCLECWEDDGPTKAILLHLSAYRYQQPDSWNGFRNIDDDLNKIYRDKVREQQAEENSHEGAHQQDQQHEQEADVSLQIVRPQLNL